jgi:hypothetical protein
MQPHSYFRKFKGQIKEGRKEERKQRKKDDVLLKTN